MTGIPSIVAGLFAYALFAIFFGPGHPAGHHGLGRAVGADDPDRRALHRGDAQDRPEPPARGRLRARRPRSGGRSSKVVLPTALAGIVTGVMLAIARVIGETAPLLVTTGRHRLASTSNPFDGRMQNLAVFAFNEYKTPGVPPEPSIRPRLDGGPRPDPHRDGAQPRAPASSTALRHRDPLHEEPKMTKHRPSPTEHPGGLATGDRVPAAARARRPR